MMDTDHLQLLLTRVMPFGKYKGRLIADLPGQYLNWFRAQRFPSWRNRHAIGADAGAGSQRPVIAAGAAAQALV